MNKKEQIKELKEQVARPEQRIEMVEARLNMRYWPSGQPYYQPSGSGGYNLYVDYHHKHITEENCV